MRAPWLDVRRRLGFRAAILTVMSFYSRRCDAFIPTQSPGLLVQPRETLPPEIRRR